MMKKGLFFYCVIASLVLHSLLVLLFKLEQAEKKEKAPIAIDLIVQPVSGPKTVIPEQKSQPRVRPNPATPSRPRISSSGPMFPLTPAPAPTRRAASPPLPQLAVPLQGLAFPQAPAQGPSGPRAANVAPSYGTPGRSAPTGPSAPASPGISESPRRLVRPTQDDLSRYADVDREVERAKDKDAITLDTDDLRYTTYINGLKGRIEGIWKYPESARRDGLQGSLVIKFVIGRSGRLEEVDIIKSSGYPLLDEAAKKALLDAQPFNPLPDNWKKDSFSITGTFVYRLINGRLDLM